MEPMSPKDKFFYWIAIYLITLVFVFVFAIVFIKIQPTGIDFAKVALGFLLGSVLGVIVGVIYGTSKTSQERAEMQTKKDAAAPVMEIPIEDLHKQLDEAIHV